jgi:predicted metalloprotease with PDZ domain
MGKIAHVSDPMRWVALFAALLCFTTSLRAADDARTDWLARYRVAFGATESGVPSAEVEATLTWTAKTKSCPKSVDLDMFEEDEFPKGYGSFVHDFLAAREPHAAETVSAPAGRYRLPVLANGSASFRYKVLMEHDASNWGPGPDEAPYRFDGGVFWTGRALFITAPRSQVEVSFSAPKGERISVSFEPLAGRADSYTVPGESRLRDSMVIVGSYREARLRVGQAIVTIALGGNLEDSMPLVEETVRRYLDASAAVFGGAPPRRILVVGNLADPHGSGGGGGGFGGDTSLLTLEPWKLSNGDDWRPFLCHELFHLWNGEAVTFGEQQQYWFSEGVTEYYSRLLPVRLGLVSAERFLETIGISWVSYLGAAGSTGLLSAGDEKFQNSALVYDGGALAAFILDLRIRAATSNHKSLDNVLKSLYKASQHQEGRGLTFDQIVRAVSAVAGRPMDHFFSRYIQGREELPLADSLTFAGIKLRTEITDLPDKGYVLWKLLLCPSVSVTPDGLLVHKSASEQIRSGDLIVGVSGSPLKTFDDLVWLFRDRRPASHVALTVIRDGKTIDLDVVLGGNPGDTVPQKPHTDVTLDMLPEADPMALQIRGSLLGSAPKNGTH